MNDKLRDKLANDFSYMSSAFEALHLERDQLRKSAEKLAIALAFFASSGERFSYIAKDALKEFDSKTPKVD